jgi:hypothetical protein
MRCFLSLVVVIATASCVAQTGTAGRATLHVTAVDDAGNPVAGARVLAKLDRAFIPPAPECRTSADGRCTMTNLDMGRYRIVTSKNVGGYPDTGFDFSNAPESSRPFVTFTADHAEEEIVVPMARRGGVLKPTIVDAETGKPINAEVVLRWVSNPDIHLSGPWPHFPGPVLAVPAGVAFTMAVSSEGYEPWTYSYSPSTGKASNSIARRASNSIELQPGEEVVLVIRLRPKRQ